MNQRKTPKAGGGVFGTLWGKLLLAVMVLGSLAAVMNVVSSKWHRAAKKGTAQNSKSKSDTTEAKPDAGSDHGDESDLLKAAEEKYEQELAARDREISRLKALVDGKGKTEDGELPPVTDFSAESGTDLRQLRSGISFKSNVEIGKGTLASKERVMPDSYTAEYTLNVRVPEPSKTMADLQGVNPALGKLLPGLPGLMEKAEVSRWYYLLYDAKTNRVKRDALQISELLSKHNFFDCETMLNLRDPQTKRRAFLMQADMDVVSDGSDGDRLATMPDLIVNSDNYQPFTSYGWPKKTATPNPLVAGWEKRLNATTKEMGLAATPANRKQALKTQAASLRRGIDDMKGRSFLIAEYDPFIVIPMNLLGANTDPFAPKVGDYAVVIHGEKMLPAIVGDGGPNFKVGEASLRIAKEINSKATPFNRPESSLKVTYLVFPGSRDETKGPPDYDRWQTRCQDLVKEIGGLGEGVEIHHWEKMLPDPPSATPPAPPAQMPTVTSPPVPTVEGQQAAPQPQPAKGTEQPAPIPEKAAGGENP